MVNTKPKSHMPINDLIDKYDSIKQSLWQQFIWNKGSKNVQLPEQVNRNPYQHSLTNPFDTNKYTCSQCSHLSNEFIVNDKNNEKYCSVIGIDSSEHAQTLSCFPVQLNSSNTVKTVCKNCGSRKVIFENDTTTATTNEYKPFTNNHCRSLPSYNQDEIKDCMVIEQQFLTNQNHSCRQNYCEVIHETDANYTYKCSPVIFDANGNIQSICTNSNLRRKQYTISKTPEEQMFFRENQTQNKDIEKYTIETFSNMLTDTMSIIEAGDRLKSLCGKTNGVVSGYNRYTHTTLE
jgi:hypothetical protein